MAVLVILFVAAAALTLTTARADSMPRSHPATTRRRSWISPTAVTACTMAGVVLVALLVNSNAGGAGTSGAGVAPAVPLSAESLTSNLLAVEVHDANDVLFVANSRYRTYWQVGVLNVLRNGVWVPDPDTEKAAHGTANGTPVIQSQGAAGPKRDFTAAVQIDDLSSRLLPVPPGTIALSGTSATLTTVGAVSTSPTTSGQQYTAVSTPPVSEPESLGANAPVTTYPPALVQADTALPALPPSIEAMARAVTAGAEGPLAQAELLVNWFRSGQFHYTLDPPASPPGTDPLVGFLTQTRSGSCEQFAGAFVVLARSLGLPSRVVVGFTAGRYGGPGVVTVRGADAHAWPQVYLGPQGRLGVLRAHTATASRRARTRRRRRTQRRQHLDTDDYSGFPDDRTSSPAHSADDRAHPQRVEQHPLAHGAFGLGVGTRVVDADRRGFRARVRARAVPDPAPPSLVSGGSHAGPAGAPVPGRGGPSATSCRGRAPYLATHGPLFRGSGSTWCSTT